MQPVTYRFLHAADLHLDQPFHGVSATAPEVAAELRDASLGALDALVRVAIASDVAFVILAGGLYHGAADGVRAQVELRRGLGELADRGIRTFVALGDDDPVDEGWTAVREWPDLVTIFPADEPTTVRVERDGAVLATVHGVSHGTRWVTEDLASRLWRTDDPGVHIAVVHASVHQGPAPPPVAPCNLDHLVASGIDYWALGHVHARAILHRDPWVVYPGDTQARRSHPDELGAKGAYLVEVDDHGIITEPEFVALDRVRFDRVPYAIDGMADVGILHDRLVDLARARLAVAGDRSILLQVELVGRGPVHDELHRPGAIAELIDALRVASLTDAPLVWWDRLEVSTRSVHDLAELQGRNDFVADLVDEAAGLLSDDEARSRRIDGWDEDLPSDLAHLLGRALPDAALADRWIQAQDLAVELVAGDES
jgi:DNA repair protein SbcD/Mre11